MNLWLAVASYGGKLSINHNLLVLASSKPKRQEYLGLDPVKKTKTSVFKGARRLLWLPIVRIQLPTNMAEGCNTGCPG